MDLINRKVLSSTTADTNSNKPELLELTDKEISRAERIGIIGLGGTGSYILDLSMRKLRSRRDPMYFDGDWYYNNNAFRSPGAPSIDDLNDSQKRKVEYFHSVYSRMHKHIV